MRTTLTLDRDVAQKVKAAEARSGKSMKSIINEALRVGLEELGQAKVKAKPFRVKPSRMILREGLSLDNIGELLAQIEGEDYK